jgi:phosphohistidine swiveling domain-containing protein
MTTRRYIRSLDSPEAKRRGGYRARQLRFLRRQNLPVPKTYVCTWDAYERYKQGDPDLSDILLTELSSTLDVSATHDVRPSVNLEDTPECSFAGQFKRALGAREVEEVLAATKSVWESTASPETEKYILSHSGDPETLRVAVLIQEMPARVVSGLSLSRNPVTGADETILETVGGTATDPTERGVRPLRCVHRGDQWRAPPPEGHIPEDVALDVVRDTRQVARAYGKPIELDWVYDGRHVTYVQLREVTSLSAAEVYSNRISREVFPGQIKPLVWSVNIPLVNGAWLWLLTELAGPNDIQPHDLAKSFYYRAYFSMGTLGQIFELLGFPRDSVELLMGMAGERPGRPRFRFTPRTLALLPRLARFFWDKLRFARKIRSFLPGASERYDAFDQRDLSGKTEPELLSDIDQLFETTQHAAYYNIVAQLQAGLYAQLLRRALTRRGIDLETVELGADELAVEELNPATHLRRLSRLFRELDTEVQAQIIGEGYHNLPLIPGAADLLGSLEEFLSRFGHLSDSGTDFSSTTWSELPQAVLQMIIDYPIAEEKVSPKATLSELDIRPPGRWLVAPIFRRAQEYAHHREAVSWVYTRGTALFHEYFLALGEHFAHRHVLRSPEDIFYLDLSEVREIVATPGGERSYDEPVRERKREMEEYADIDLPPLIYGDYAPPLDAPVAGALAGMGTSIGEYTGPVRVVRGIKDFDKVQQGDVLAIPYSDVSWTPLFARAGAVISESGGILAHSSIVAREYGIPAVVSVDGATRLADGALVTVDGYNGIVQVH